MMLKSNLKLMLCYALAFACSKAESVEQVPTDSAFLSSELDSSSILVDVQIASATDCEGAVCTESSFAMNCRCPQGQRWVITDDTAPVSTIVTQIPGLFEAIQAVTNSATPRLLGGLGVFTTTDNNLDVCGTQSGSFGFFNSVDAAAVVLESGTEVVRVGCLIVNSENQAVAPPLPQLRAQGCTAQLSTVLGELAASDARAQARQNPMMIEHGPQPNLWSKEIIRGPFACRWGYTPNGAGGTSSGSAP